MYYRCALDLKREMLTDHGPDGLCTQNEKCMGRFSGDILARVISRMLYVTLPERGLLPLTKPEAVKMALSDIKPGIEVDIVLKKDQRNGKLTRGVVKDILTKSAGHPHGIKARLVNGKVGRVKKIRASY